MFHCVHLHVQCIAMAKCCTREIKGIDLQYIPVVDSTPARALVLYSGVL